VDEVRAHVRSHLAVVGSTLLLIGTTLFTGVGQYDLFGPPGDASALAASIFVVLTCASGLLVPGVPWRRLRSSVDADAEDDSPDSGRLWDLLTASRPVSVAGLVRAPLVAVLGVLQYGVVTGRLWGERGTPPTEDPYRSR